MPKETKMSKPYDHSVLFPDDMLVEFANRLLEEAGERISIDRVSGRGERYVYFAALGPRGGRMHIVAPTGSAKTGTLFIRSLLKVSKGATFPEWMINGQGGQGTSEIVFLGENGPWLSTSLSNLRDYYAGGRNHVSPHDLGKFETWLENHIAEIESEGYVSDAAEVHSFGDESSRRPLTDNTTSVAP